MCQPGAIYDRIAVFRLLRQEWADREKKAGRKGTGKVLAAHLREFYPTVNPQRVCQWSTGSDNQSRPPEHIIQYMCWILGLKVVLAPEGAQVRRKDA
jgi:hypothetical protein